MQTFESFTSHGSYGRARNGFSRTKSGFTSNYKWKHIAPKHEIRKNSSFWESPLLCCYNNHWMMGADSKEWPNEWTSSFNKDAPFGVGVLVKEVYFFKLYFEIIIHSLEVAKKCTRSFTQHTPNVSILHNWSKIPTPGNRLWYKPQSLFRFHQFYMQNLCMCIALCYFMTCFV